MKQIINAVLGLYIISLYTLSERPELCYISNIIAAVWIYLVLVWMFANKKRLRTNSFLVLFLCFVLCCALTYYVALDKGAVLAKTVTLFLNLILVAALINYLDDLKKVNQVIRYFVFSGVIAAGYILLNSDLSVKARLGSVIGNVNEIGILISISFVFCIYLITSQNKYCYSLPAALMFPVVLMSGSRKSILFILFTLLIFFYLTNKNKLRFVISSIFLLMLFYYVIFEIPDIYMVLGKRFVNLLDFFGEGTTEGSVLKRAYMIEFGYEMFKLKPIMGYGLANYQFLLGKAIHLKTYAHNNYIELLVGTGLVGTIAFYVMYLDLFVKLKKMKINRELGSILLALNLATLAIGYSLVHYDKKHFYIILAISSVIKNLKLHEGGKGD